MKLTATKRVKDKKNDAKRIRRDGQIPGVIYASGAEAESITIDGREFEAILRGVQQGHLSTTKIVLNLDGNDRNVVVKDIQYHPTTYRILHLDLEELKDDQYINIKVPIVPIGVMDCVGIKLGGFLRPIVRSVKVKCLPKHIPTRFEVNVRSLGIKQSKRLSDIQMPEGVYPLTNLNEVVVVIAKR